MAYFRFYFSCQLCFSVGVVNSLHHLASLSKDSEVVAAPDQDLKADFRPEGGSTVQNTQSAAIAESERDLKADGRVGRGSTVRKTHSAAIAAPDADLKADFHVEGGNTVQNTYSAEIEHSGTCYALTGEKTAY